MEVGDEAEAEIDPALSVVGRGVDPEIGSDGDGGVWRGRFAFIGVVSAGLFKGYAAIGVSGEQSGDCLGVFTGGFDAQLKPANFFPRLLR